MNISTSSTKKIHFRVITVLNLVSRDKWPTSHQVSKEILGCQRVHGIIARVLKKRGVHLSLIEDILSEVALVLQMKILPILDSPENVYSVIFRIAELVVSNYGKKSINTLYSQEILLSDLMSEGDTNHTDILDRLSNETSMDNDQGDTVKRLDLDRAKKNLKDKIGRLGWPEDIRRERTRLGRPKKVLQTADAT